MGTGSYGLLCFEEYIMISVIYFTYRLGGFDLLLDSLKKQTCKDWELIVVDDCKDRNLSAMFESEDLPLAWYGQSKEKKYNDTKFNVMNAMNTGLQHAKGDVILYVHDYSWLRSDGLLRFQESFKDDRKKLVVGCGLEYNYTGEFAMNGYSMFNPPFSSFEDGRFNMYHNWIPDEFEMFYTAYPKEFLDAIGGFEEKCDYDVTSDYLWMVGKAKSLGYRLVVDKENYVLIVNHREWNLGNEKMWNVRKI
jgi:glycosyltransferase involved in cell wall biosynthesis